MDGAAASRVALAVALGFALAAGCSPSIGDECGSSVNCDINGTRICDTTSPGGYCTIRGCDVGTCPADESVCVAFFPDTPRLTDTFCMATCENNADCRDGYACFRGSDLGAVVRDGDGKKFCAVPPPPGE